MDSVTYSNFIRKTGKSVAILLAIISFVIYKLIKGGFDNEYIIIGLTTVIGLIAIGRLGGLLSRMQ